MIVMKIEIFYLALLAIGLASDAASQPYTIGIPAPLTGANMAAGTELRRGFELGREFFQADDVKLTFEDDACDSAKSLTVNKKLIEIDRVSAISGIYCNTSLFSVTSLINRSGLTALTTGATTGDQLGVGKKIFRLWPADQLAIKPLFPEILKRGKRLCLMTESDVYSELIRRHVNKSWPEQCAECSVVEEAVNAREPEFRTPITRLSKRGCDSMFLNLAGDDGFISAFRQVKILAPNLPMFALYYPGSAGVQKALGDALKGVAYADLPSSDAAATPLGLKFIELYKKRHGEFLLSAPAALLAFEALRLINEARKQGVPLDEFLRRGPITDGAIKEYSFDSDGAIQGLDFIVKKPYAAASIASGP
jgi:ABC-type branched-subunit amino acid transport system substrate-binding protein